MADDAPVIPSLERARRAPTPLLVLVESHPQANAYGHAPVEPLPRARFHPAVGGAVRLGVVRLAPDVVAELVRLFEREAWKTGDYSLFDELCAARDGINPEPPKDAA